MKILFIQVFVSLEEPGEAPNEGEDYPSTLVNIALSHNLIVFLQIQIFKSSDNELGIDLLKVSGTKEKANLYVTTLVQMMYTMDELVRLQPANTQNDERYKQIKGNMILAVLCCTNGFFRSGEMQIQIVLRTVRDNVQ